MIQFYMEEEDPNSTALIAALSTLPPPTLSSLTTSLSSAFRHHRHRVSTILSSPPLFSATLRRLFSLSLPQKSLLIAKYLLSTLQPVAASLAPPAPPPSAARIRLRDLDAVLVLLLFCEVRQHDPVALETTSSRDWHRVLAAYYCDNVLSLSGLKVSPNEAVRSLVDVVAKCRRFVGSAISGCEASAGREVAASAATVVALPSVAVNGSGAAAECAICKEEMSEGRDVCELPCEHLFHWMCVLRWLRERNTCPCCRHRLPTDDVYGEIERLWEVVVRAARPHLHVDVCKHPNIE
ncbi:hypothetical protein V2J09_010429 [Rumex salicifolius]